MTNPMRRVYDVTLEVYEGEWFEHCTVTVVVGERSGLQDALGRAMQVATNADQGLYRAREARLIREAH